MNCLSSNDIFFFTFEITFILKMTLILFLEFCHLTPNMCESFQDHSWFQDFEAYFP